MAKHLPPLVPLNYPQAHCVGEVFIHPHAVIASGVLLWAESGSRLEIAAGACIGMGTILHAQGGKMVVATGASLGAGVLFIGSGEIAAQACIGAATTLINTSVDAGAVIPPGSLLGDTSRQVPILEHSTLEPTQDSPEIAPPSPSPTTEPLEEPAFGLPEAAVMKTSQETLDVVTEATEQITETSTKTIYGQVYVNQMLQHMFNRSPRPEPPPDPWQT
ncbi:hypothetical protein RIF25_05105 [Thermosynechococcaceae cyanobacterium BACA0444]|uniref:Carbon dioxide concentrating mechanism protein n=1 Tax=Pseudocalidococcus azoricus BACA0444 TaxID=2918990 RepID=A0AAE4FQ14_9CYAN|nr:hypothetical protein [Pseudocalidococcus azoricus]MDS3860178.1 hypothetical protein [Pseudocalidococcus azoricus BACA0444]